MVNSKLLSELREQLKDCSIKLGIANNEHRSLKMRLEKECEDKLYYSTENINLQQSQKQYNKIKNEYQDEKDRLELEKAHSDLSYPIGTKLVRWGYKGSVWTFRNLEILWTGVFEIWTKDSKYPANQAYGIPIIGTEIVRKLTKSGEPGLRFEQYDDERFYLEGVKPLKK